MIYFLFLLIPIFFIFINVKHKIFAFNIYYVLLAFFVGLRLVGSDYQIYLRHYERVQSLEKFELFSSSDFAFDYLIYVLKFINLPYEFFVFFTALFFLYSLYRILARFDNPWIPLAICLPFLIFIFSMSAIRQSVALGFLFLSFEVILYQKNQLKFFIYFFLGCLFHKSLIIFIFYYILLEKNILKLFLVSLLLIIFILIFRGDELFRLGYHYLFISGDNLYSPGVYLRVIPFIFSLFLFYKVIIYKIKNYEKNFFIITSVYLVFFVLLIFLNTTLSDRLLYYLYIMNIFMLSNFISYYKENKKIYIFNSLIVISVVYGLYLLWFLKGNTVHQWYPYKSIIF